MFTPTGSLLPNTDCPFSFRHRRRRRSAQIKRRRRDAAAAAWCSGVVAAEGFMLREGGPAGGQTIPVMLRMRMFARR